jgi:hypothetical protein
MANYVNAKNKIYLIYTFTSGEVKSLHHILRIVKMCTFKLLTILILIQEINCGNDTDTLTDYGQHFPPYMGLMIIFSGIVISCVIRSVLTVSKAIIPIFKRHEIRNFPEIQCATSFCCVDLFSWSNLGDILFILQYP